MNATQVNQAPVQISADLRDDAPVLVEVISIEELAAREEYAACYTITK